MGKERRARPGRHRERPVSAEHPAVRGRQLYGNRLQWKRERDFGCGDAGCDSANADSKTDTDTETEPDTFGDADTDTLASSHADP